MVFFPPAAPLPEFVDPCAGLGKETGKAAGPKATGLFVGPWPRRSPPPPSPPHPGRAPPPRNLVSGPPAPPAGCCFFEIFLSLFYPPGPPKSVSPPPRLSSVPSSASRNPPAVPPPARPYIVIPPTRPGAPPGKKPLGRPGRPRSTPFFLVGASRTPVPRRPPRPGKKTDFRRKKKFPNTTRGGFEFWFPPVPVPRPASPPSRFPTQGPLGGWASLPPPPPPPPPRRVPRSLFPGQPRSPVQVPCPKRNPLCPPNTIIRPGSPPNLAARQMLCPTETQPARAKPSPALFSSPPRSNTAPPSPYRMAFAPPPLPIRPPPYEHSWGPSFTGRPPPPPPSPPPSPTGAKWETAPFSTVPRPLKKEKPARSPRPKVPPPCLFQLPDLEFSEQSPQPPHPHPTLFKKMILPTESPPNPPKTPPGGGGPR